MDSLAGLLPKLSKTKMTKIEMTADYLVKEYNNEIARDYYRLISHQLPRSVIINCIGRAKTANDPKRLFAYLTKKHLLT